MPRMIDVVPTALVSAGSAVATRGDKLSAVTATLNCEARKLPGQRQGATAFAYQAFGTEFDRLMAAQVLATVRLGHDLTTAAQEYEATDRAAMHGLISGPPHP